MSLKKTIILVIILCVLLGIAYVVNRPPKKATEERLLFPEFDSEKVTTIRLYGQEHQLTLNKMDDQWIALEEDELPADKDQIAQALQTVAELNRDDIISKNPSKQDIFQVDPNNGYEVMIQGEEDETLAHFYIGKNGPDFMSTYVRKADSDEVILYSGFHLKSRFDKPADSWLDKFVLLLQEPDVDRVEFKRTEEFFSLVKDHESGKWRLDMPEEADVKENIVKDLTQTLFNLRAAKLQRHTPDKPLEEFGLDPPSVTMTIVETDETSKILLLGNKDEKTDQYFVKVADSDIIYSVGKFSIEKIDKTLQDVKAETPAPQEEPPVTAPPITPPPVPFPPES